MKRVVEDFILYPFGALGPRKDLRQNIQVVHAFIDKHIDRVLQARQSPAGLPEHAAEEQQSVLEQLAESTQDKCEIRSDMLNLLFAGRDSTASSLTNCFYFLARRPDIWQALRLEVSQANIACADTASLRTLPYLQACLQESLRLHPPVFFNSRTAIRDTLLPSGGGFDGSPPLFVRKGTTIVCNIYALHRREVIWGDDAADFRPERWLEGKKQTWHHLPFSGGPQTCLGQQMALTEAGYLLMRLAEEFKRIEAADDEGWTEKLEFTCCTTTGTSVRLYS